MRGSVKHRTKPTPKQLRAKCDKMLSNIIKLEWGGRCGVCGKAGQHAHHYFGKKAFPHLRYETCNLIWLCAGCHFQTHNTGKTTEQIRDAIIKRWGDKMFETIKHEAYQKKFKAALEDELEFLEHRTKELDGKLMRLDPPL